MHMRPLVDTKSPAGLNQFEAISDAVTDLVVEYGGSVSGEHGDGRARTQWNRKLYEGRLVALPRREDRVRPRLAPESRHRLWRPRHDRASAVLAGVRVRRGLRARPRVGKRQRHAGDGRTLSRLRWLSRLAGDDRRRHVPDVSRGRGREPEHPRPGEHAPRGDERRTRRRVDRSGVPGRSDGSLYRLQRAVRGTARARSTWPNSRRKSNTRTIRKTARASATTSCSRTSTG